MSPRPATPKSARVIAGRPSDMAKMPEGRGKVRARKQEHRKASIRAKVEHPFRVIKRQFGLAKLRFKGGLGQRLCSARPMRPASRVVLRRFRGRRKQGGNDLGDPLCIVGADLAHRPR